MVLWKVVDLSAKWVDYDIQTIFEWEQITYDWLMKHVTKCCYVNDVLLRGDFNTKQWVTYMLNRAPNTHKTPSPIREVVRLAPNGICGHPEMSKLSPFVWGLARPRGDMAMCKWQGCAMLVVRVMLLDTFSRGWVHFIREGGVGWVWYVCFHMRVWNIVRQRLSLSTFY